MNGYEIASIIVGIGLYFGLKLLFRGITIGMKAETESEWKFFESALKESYKEGIRDAINICDEAIENDISGALRNRTWIRNKLQQLKEKNNG